MVGRGRINGSEVGTLLFDMPLDSALFSLFCCSNSAACGCRFEHQGLRSASKSGILLVVEVG